MKIAKEPKDPKFIAYMKKLFEAGASFEAFLTVLCEIRADTSLTAVQRQAIIRTIVHDQCVQYGLIMKGLLPTPVEG